MLCRRGNVIRVSSDSCPFLSADGMRAVLRNGVYIRNGERFRLVSFAITGDAYSIKAEFANGGILRWVTGSPDKFVYCKKDDELGYVETGLSFETQTNGGSVNDAVAMVSENGQYVFIGEYSFAKLYKVSYDQSGEVTGFEEVVFELNAADDLYYGHCFVKEGYAYCHTRSTWKLYEITGLSAAYVKSLGSWGHCPAVMGDIVLTKEGWVNTSDPLNPVYTSNDWWPTSSSSTMTIYTRQDKAYYIASGASPYCAVKWTGEQVTVLKSSSSDYVMAGGTEGDFVAVRSTNTGGQRIGFSKVDDDLNVLEDYSSPKMGAASLNASYRYIPDEEGNLYCFNDSSLWQYTAQAGLSNTGTIPAQSGSYQALCGGKIYGETAFSYCAGQVTKLTPYEGNATWAATNVSTNSMSKFNNAGYIMDTVGNGGKFAADGTYTAYTKSGSSPSSTNAIMVGLPRDGNFGIVARGQYSQTYVMIINEEAGTITGTSYDTGWIYGHPNSNKYFLTGDGKYVVGVNTDTAVISVMELDEDTHAPSGEVLYPSAMQPVTNKEVAFCDMTYDGTLILWHEDGSIRTFKYNDGMDIMDIQEVDLALPLPLFEQASSNDKIFFSPDMRFVCVNKTSTPAVLLIIDRQEGTSAYAYKAERYRGNNFASGTLTGIVSEAPEEGADGQKTVKVKTILPEENI